MRSRIGPDLVRQLPRRDGDIRDRLLAGFVVRTRQSGTHSYIMQLGRGRVVTLGRVGVMSPEAARAAAEAMAATVSRDTLRHLADDPSTGVRAARARAREALRGPRAHRRAQWAEFLTQDYEPWALANLKTGADTLARLRGQFAAFDTLRVSEITTFTIEKWRTARLRAGTSPATVRRDLAALQGALSKALEWGAITVHPMAGLTRGPKTDKIGRLRFLDAEEEQRLLDALAARDDRRRAERDRANAWRQARGYTLWPAFGAFTDHLSPIVRLALHTGLRRGELFGLTWGDVDLARATLRVRADDAKTGEGRVVPLNTHAAGVLRDWRPADAQPDARVFPGDDGKRLTTLKTAFSRVLQDAKIERFRFHDLRHTFASKLVQAAVDLNTVRELLGHTEITMTLRYAHLSPSHRSAAVEKIAGAVVT